MVHISNSFLFFGRAISLSLKQRLHYTINDPDLGSRHTMLNLNDELPCDINPEDARKSAWFAAGTLKSIAGTDGQPVGYQ